MSGWVSDKYYKVQITLLYREESVAALPSCSMSDSVMDIGVWIGLAPSRLYRESMSQIQQCWFRKRRPVVDELPTLLERNAH
jgi:hypothetical protein